MRTDIVRTFHPVGQGAFYSERINGFNFVYDCGTHSSQQGGKNAVSQSFSKDEIIDMLAISHFDEDHINLIPELRMSVQDIKLVILPLMSAEQKLFVLSNYKNHTLYDILLNPESYFSAAKIVYVRPAVEGRTDTNRESNYTTLLEGSQKKIDSGTKIYISPNYTDWIFIPYNYNNAIKHNEIKIEFDRIKKKRGIDIYDTKSIIEALKDKNKKDEIKKIYKGIGGTNVNSLLMYSGPANNDTCCLCDISTGYYQPYYWHSRKAGCIYTGDATMNRDTLPWIDTIKQNFDVGTIQIPHHGSLNSFDETLIDNGPFNCVISVGRKNRYNHPSNKVLVSILLKGMHPILVTDEPLTFFIELFT